MNFGYLKQSDNLALLAQIRASSEYSSIYAASHLISMPVAHPWRSAEGDISGVTIDLDFGYPVAPDMIALANHNLTSGMTATLYGGSIPNPDGSQKTVTLDWRRRSLWKSFAAASYEHWRLTLTDEANPYGFLQIGYLSLGVLTVVASPFKYGWSRQRLTAVRVSQSEAIGLLYGPAISQQEAYSLPFDAFGDVDRASLDTFLESLEQGAQPLFLVPNAEQSEGFFGRMTSDYSIEQRNQVVNEFSDIRFSEDAPGIILGEDPPFHYEP